MKEIETALKRSDFIYLFYVYVMFVMPTFKKIISNFLTYIHVYDVINVHFLLHLIDLNLF